MEARAGTDNNLGRLTRVMQIDAPFIIINSKIAKDGFAMAGTLSFEDDPIQVDISLKPTKKGNGLNSGA